MQLYWGTPLIKSAALVSRAVRLWRHRSVRCTKHIAPDGRSADIWAGQIWGIDVDGKNTSRRGMLPGRVRWWRGLSNDSGHTAFWYSQPLWHLRTMPRFFCPVQRSKVFGNFHCFKRGKNCQNIVSGISNTVGSIIFTRLIPLTKVISPPKRNGERENQFLIGILVQGENREWGFEPSIMSLRTKINHGGSIS